MKKYKDKKVIKTANGRVLTEKEAEKEAQELENASLILFGITILIVLILLI